jgi:hypothetical protein
MGTERAPIFSGWPELFFYPSLPGEGPCDRILSRKEAESKRRYGAVKILFILSGGFYVL